MALLTPPATATTEAALLAALMEKVDALSAQVQYLSEQAQEAERARHEREELFHDITPALKEYEEKVLGADERILEREVELFEQLRGRVQPHQHRRSEHSRRRPPVPRPPARRGGWAAGGCSGPRGRLRGDRYRPYLRPARSDGRRAPRPPRSSCPHLPSDARFVLPVDIR